MTLNWLTSRKSLLLGLLPVDDAQALGLLSAVLAVGHGDRDAVLEQPIDLAVGRLQAHRRAVAGQLVDGDGDRLGRQRGVERCKRGAQAGHQHDLALRLAPERAARAEGLLHRRHRLPAERREQPDGGLLDELVFGVGVRAWLRRPRTSLCPESRRGSSRSRVRRRFWIRFREIDYLGHKTVQIQPVKELRRFLIWHNQLQAADATVALMPGWAALAFVALGIGRRTSVH